MTRRCLCDCHRVVRDPVDTDPASLAGCNRADGVDPRDELYAFSACAKCQNAHVAALTDARDAQMESGATDGDATGYAPTDNGEGQYLPPQPWNGEEGG